MNMRYIFMVLSFFAMTAMAEDKNTTTTPDTVTIKDIQGEDFDTGTTTSIKTTDKKTVRPATGKIYTLSGRLVAVREVSDLPKGIYIVNGKKILVK